LLFGLWVLSPLTAAQQPTTIAGAEEAIMRADALGAGRDFSGAIAILKRSLGKYPTYERLYLSLAYWQEVKGIIDQAVLPTYAMDARKYHFRTQLQKFPALARDLFETYGQAMMNVQDARVAPRFARSLIYQEFPLELGQFGPLALPADPTFYTYTLSDMALPAERRGTRQCLITTKPWELVAYADNNGNALPGYQEDPKYGPTSTAYTDQRYGGWTFNRMIVAYELEPETKLWKLRFRIFWQDAPSRSAARRQLARSTAELLLRLSGLARAYGGFTPRFAADGVMNIWLAEKGQAGGEAVNNNIYLFEVGTPRAEAEWVRELAHEYGHSTLPMVGGYAQPEWGANGRLGERLFLRWLLRNPSPAEAHPWVKALNAAELKNTRIDAPIRLFASLGPHAPKLRETDATAMDGFVGLALYLEQAHGSAALSWALSNIKSPLYGTGEQDGGFRAMVESYSRILLGGAQPFVTLNVSDLPKDLPYWVYLTEGVWRIELAARDDAPMQVTVEVDGTACTARSATSYTTPTLPPGWHRLRVSPEGIILPALSTIKLVKE